MIYENPTIESINDLIESRDYDISEKTLMEIEHDYEEYRKQIRWTEHILRLASEKEEEL